MPLVDRLDIFLTLASYFQDDLARNRISIPVSNQLFRIYNSEAVPLKRLEQVAQEVKSIVSSADTNKKVAEFIFSQDRQNLLFSPLCLDFFRGVFEVELRSVEALMNARRAAGWAEDENFVKNQYAQILNRQEK